MKTFKMGMERIDVPADEELFLEKDEYQNNDHIAIAVYSTVDGPLTYLTTNIKGVELYPRNFSCLDTGNFPEGVEMVRLLGIGEYTGINIRSGFNEYPLYVFDEDELNKYVREEIA